MGNCGGREGAGNPIDKRVESSVSIVVINIMVLVRLVCYFNGIMVIVSLHALANFTIKNPKSR